MAEITFAKKVENYWFYYKWHTIFGVAIIIVLITTISTWLTTAKPDLTVIVALSDTSQTQKTVSAQYSDYFTPYLTDVNHDGKKTVDIEFVNSPQTSTTDASLFAEKVTEDTTVIMVTDDGTNPILPQITYLDDMTKVLPEATGGSKSSVPAASFKALSDKNLKGIYISVRQLKANSKSTLKDNYANSVATLKRMLTVEKTN
jgi:hypothetical protein